jgi:AcrR family transcriptional regulator
VEHSTAGVNRGAPIGEGRWSGRRIIAVTGSQDWRRQRWEETHQRIYAAALRLFQEHGFDRVSVGQIASASGVSVPTFYAHYPSKEHVIMKLPTAEDMAALMATQPADLPVGARLRRAAPLWLAQLGAEERAEMLARWRVIAVTPVLRTRAAEFERSTAEMVAGALPGQAGVALTPAQAVIVNAYLAAYTAGLLEWADGEGRGNLEEIVDRAFQALDQER